MRKPVLVVGLLVGLTALGLTVLEARRSPERVLGAVTTDLSERTVEQRQNIETASAAIDGHQVAAGEHFSFNAVVGPRTVARGYRDATALMEGNRITSVGGGICQLSSTLYGAAKRAGCLILRRVPHRGRVQSVPPGEDATVWYGGADLIWRAPVAVTIKATIHGDKLIVAILRPAG